MGCCGDDEGHEPTELEALAAMLRGVVEFSQRGEGFGVETITILPVGKAPVTLRFYRGTLEEVT